MAGHRDRSSRAGKKGRAAAKHSNEPSSGSSVPHPGSVPAAAPDPVVAYPNPDSDPTSPDRIPDPDPIYHDESECGYCTEEQLEDLLLKNLDFAYNEALSRLASLGYTPEVALHAVLCAGHCCGPSDVITNIVTNTADYLNNPTGSTSGSSSSSGGFTDLRRLEEYSLAGMVCLVQQHRHGISRGDAMWCLLMGELHVARACQIELPPPSCCSSSSCYPASQQENALEPAPSNGLNGGTLVSNGSAFAASGGLLRHDPATSGFRPFSTAGHGKDSTLSEGFSRGSSDVVDKVLKELEEINEQEGITQPDPQSERIYDLARQVRELEAQVKERQEWAQQKALQAAQKLSKDMTELRMLRLDKEQRERLKRMGKQQPTLDETTVKKLVEMEEGLKKASLQVDRANAAVQRLETENAEIRAEMEAAKLSAAESARTRQEAARREKRCRKKSQLRDRQRELLQEEIDEQQKKAASLQRDIEETRKASKHFEAKITEERKDKEDALVELLEMDKSTEATKVNAQRRLDTARRKMELESQRCQDDVQRLEEQLGRMQLQNTLTAKFNPPNPTSLVTTKQRATPVKKVSCKWQCVVCVKDEVSVLLLPCAHQVLCVGCNEAHERTGKAGCPCCNSRIEERICVYGVSS